MAATSANPLYLLLDTVDLSTLSLSELHSLSLLSNNPSLTSINSGTAVQINTSFFNESAGSRQQTYSTTPNRHHHRTSAFSEKDRQESISIVGFLKRYFNPNADATLPSTTITTMKKKRKKGDKTESSSVVEIVNRNGVVVDLAALEEAEEEERENEGEIGPFSDELRRRAAGREKEEELLEVLAGMKGRWCSKRKKRRIVDASLLGDALPVGWNIIIALRRKGGRFSPYCRRYISPSGEQFSSCKEVASYLKSHFGIDDSELIRDSRGESQQLQQVDVINHQYVKSKDDLSVLDMPISSISSTCLAIKYDKEVSFSSIEDLPDVQVLDLYECHACNVTFDVKDDYLQHMLSTHEKTTKKYTIGSSLGDEVNVRDANHECHTSIICFDEKDGHLQHQLPARKSGPKKRRLGSSVGDGVIIRDGKYECQFCHKVFEERRRYLGHVGNHVKGSIRTPKELLREAGLPCMDQLKAKSGKLKIDALVVVGHSSVEDVLPSVLEKEPSCFDNVNQTSVSDFCRSQNADRNSEIGSKQCVDELNTENCGGEATTLCSLLNPCDKGSWTVSVCPTETETGKNKGRCKIRLHTPCSQVTGVSMADAEISGSISCLDEHGTDQFSAEANMISGDVYSIDRMGQIPLTDEYINTSASCPSDLEMEKVGRDEPSSLGLNNHVELSVIHVLDPQTKGQAYTSGAITFEKNSCLDAIMEPVGNTCIHADVSTGKSTATEDDASTGECEGEYDHFSQDKQKASDAEATGYIVQSGYIDEHELGHFHIDDGIDLDGVSSDTNAIGCTAPQTSVNSSPFDEIFGKVGQDIYSLDPNLESGSAFEYMKLDVIEPQMYEYNGMGGEDSMLLPEVSIGLEKDASFNLGFNASAKSESDFPGINVSTSMAPMLCVWCGLEFSDKAVDKELQQDSVGFMCPACRTKISKQFNELESNFSVNPQYF